MNETLQNDLDKYKSKKGKKSNLFIGIFLLLIIVGLCFYFFMFNQNEQKEFHYDTSKIKKGDLEVVVSATGNLKPTNSVDIGIEVSGTIKDIYVDFNDEVKVGQILAKLDTTKLQSQVDSSKASLTIAKANLKENEVNVKSKKLTYTRTLRMYEQSGGKYPSQNILDESKFDYESALSSFDSMEAKVKQAEFNLKTDEQNLDKAVVKSSINGIVLNRAVEVGQTVAASMSTPVLFTLAKDLSKMDLVVSIDEADVADIKKGLNVTFTVDAYPKETFKGKIKQVRLNPVEVNGVVTYETVVLVDNEKLFLRPGMTASAEIITKESKDKLLVPNSALRFKPTLKNKENKNGAGIVGPKRPMVKREAKSVGKIEFGNVWILKDNKPQRIRIKILDTNGTVTSVESKDLKVDDEVIISQSSDDE
ncbi:efflux RND transporter periplasmic adaptor subunit [Arcobacter sp. F2176]|uniref:efflux RND transporter periplasmic adaptor subunit n=1 Tax=Arcobacter sp. F2176 TaxID=2044511 RepID=UPI00100C3015|nr:efflux RND transporter periplasmic adaptor subunit [Arcobacter sp. F2176]RXJ80925.1 efflux transporter periplasmic adaptor subunit [Arcobacter sp. F2176]